MSMIRAVNDDAMKGAELVGRGATVEKAAEVVEMPVEELRRALKRPELRNYVAYWLDQAGATVEASARAIAEAHGAVKRQVVSYLGSAEVVEIGPDHEARLKAAQMNYTVRGIMRENQAISLVFAELDDLTLAKLATGEIDPATLIDLGPRIDNPAGQPIPNEAAPAAAPPAAGAP